MLSNGSLVPQASELQGQDLVGTVLVGGGRKIEHYEIAGYTAVMEMAEAMGEREVARLLRQTLGEEERMDSKLAQLGSRLVKQEVRRMRESQREAQPHGKKRRVA